MNESWLLPQLLEHGAALLGTALVLNTMFTFAGAAALALLAAKVVGSPRLAKFILITPWVRVVYDVVRGATENAYVLSEHAGTKGALGTFQLGIGGPFVPVLRALVGMRGGEHQYDYSVGDLFGHWLYRHLGALPLLAGLILLSCVSAALLAIRVRQYRRWQLRLASAQARACRIEAVHLPLRTLQIVTCAGSFGAFTSGVSSPRIWLSEGLDGERRAAVLEHEMAHAKDADVLWFGIVGFLSDLFWFVPLARLLERRLHDRAEEAADARALARGVDPRVLAEGILEQAASGVSAGPAPRMAGARSRLARRLLALSRTPDGSRWKLALRVAAAACLTVSVFRSVFGGYM